MYSAELLNRLQQFGYVEYTLVLTDRDGVLPRLSISKSYSAGLSEEDVIRDVEETVKLHSVLPIKEEIIKKQEELAAIVSEREREIAELIIKKEEIEEVRSFEVKG